MNKLTRQVAVTWFERVEQTGTVWIDPDELRDWAGHADVTEAELHEYIESGPEANVANGESIETAAFVGGAS